MKKLAIYFLFIFCAHNAAGQFYLRGEIKDEKNQPLQNVKIFVHSSRTLFYSGTYGSFGFTVVSQYDSLTFSIDGFETRSIRVKSDAWQNIILKVTNSHQNKNKPRLISVTTDMKKDNRFSWFVSNETYFQLVENEEVDATRYPNTSFTLNVNKASYSNVRRFLNMKSTVPPDAVRIEEMLNYFNLHYREPAPGKVFNIESQLSSCPWNVQRQLLFLNVSARKISFDKIPPGNFVFLIDVSGSMDMPNRLPLLKAAFQLFIKNLRPIDTVSIVTYGGNVAVWMQPTSGAEKEKISKAIEELTAAGDTPGESAIRTAYKIAESTFIEGGNNRVILATDGDFNVGESTEKALDELISKQRQTGIYLTCLGVGMGNFKDSKLQVLARRGNGNYAYLDDIREAEKVLVKEITQTLYAVADNVYMNVEFNPTIVKAYRLIGFDNKKEVMTDAESEMEGSEVGSANSTLAIFEIVPIDQNITLTRMGLMKNIANLTLMYHTCNDTTAISVKQAVNDFFIPIDSIDKDLRFAAAVSFFGLKLKQSKYLPYMEWKKINLFAQSAVDKNNFLQNEFLQLITKAEKIYGNKKKKRRFL
ncbi:MAG: von Willebrand factor type A domain-containing protein [Ferruginibacter sp.]